MGACGSSKQVTPGDETKSTDQSLWKPDKLTFEMIKEAFPDFSKDLKSIRMVSMSQKLEWGGGSQDGAGGGFVDELENAGSETGAMLRKMECTWKNGVPTDRNHPKYVIVKMTDVTEVPQMELLKSKPWLKRWIVKKLLAGPGLFLWDAIPRVILAESRVNTAALQIKEVRKLLPKLHFTRVQIGGTFPTMDEWVKKGIGAVAQTWTLQATEEIKPPMTSAFGATGCWKGNGVTFVVAKMILRALAKLHAINWDPENCRQNDLVKWIHEKNPKADTTTFFYPMKFGLWPRGQELPDVDAPFSFGGDIKFSKLDVERFAQQLGLGIGNMATDHIGTLRKLQQYLPKIQREVCLVSDIKGKKNCKRCQTILHGDAHAWNIFWNGDVKTENDEIFDKEGCVRFIDLTNFGTGRVAWEVHYFLSTSYHHDWDEVQLLLKDYYDTLVKHNPKAKIGFSYQDFRKEYNLLGLLNTAHHFAKMARTGKYSGTKAKKLRRQSTTVGKKGGKARKTIGNVTQQTDGLLSQAQDILHHEEDKLFGKK